MRHVVCVVALLLAAPAAGQTPPDLSGEWIGAMSALDTSFDVVRRVSRITRVTLTQDPRGELTGDFRTTVPPVLSGPMSGRVNSRGEVAIELTVYAGATYDDKTTETERCVGIAAFRGELVTFAAVDPRSWLRVGPDAYERRWHDRVLHIRARGVLGTAAIDALGKRCRDNIVDVSLTLEPRDTARHRRFSPPYSDPNPD